MPIARRSRPASPTRRRAASLAMCFLATTSAMAPSPAGWSTPSWPMSRRERPPSWAITLDWTRDRLGAGQENFLRGLPLTAEAGDRLFVHASAWEPARWDYVTGPAAALRSFEATQHQKTFCGHLHVPEVYHLGRTAKIASFIPAYGTGIPLIPQRRWLAVVGSVGQPRDGVPAASYAVLDKVRAAGLPEVLALRLLQGR